MSMNYPPKQASPSNLFGEKNKHNSLCVGKITSARQCTKVHNKDKGTHFYSYFRKCKYKFAP
jgi:hypothetical protein